MKEFCIPRNEMSKVVSAVKDLGAEPLKKLGSMSTKERVQFFKKTLPDADAIKVNSKFEKAIAAQKLEALSTWVKNNLDQKYRDEFSVNEIQKKIKNLDEMNSYIDSNLENFVLQKNKVALSSGEVKQFNELGKKVLEAQKKVGDNVGDVVENYEGNLAYAKALSEIQEYTQSLVPSSAFNTFRKSVGKAIMLASIKSPLLNIVANTVNGVMEAFSRRFSNARIGGKVDSSVMKDYVKGINKIYKETGIDFSRMISVNDVTAGIGKTLGESIATPKNKYVKGFTDFIFNKTLSTPDVLFSSLHFADSANLVSSRYAKEGLDANTIFKDALLINPKTTEGKIVRMQALSDAMYATFTNDSANAKLNNGIRKLLGPVGDFMMPFVKTPSNIVESGLDYSGLGALKGIYKMQSAVRAEGLRNVSKEQWQEIARDVTRAGLGMTGAYLLANTINTDEFMGAYDPQRVGIDQLKNTSYNAIKVGGKWINVDYLGPIGIPLVSMMYAKKYGSRDGMMKSYASGMVQQFAKSPGIAPLASTVDNMLSVDPETGKGLDVSKAPQAILDTFSSFTVPGVMYDLSKAFDGVQRDTSLKKYSVSNSFIDLNFDKFIAKLPFIRETLTEKHDSLGRVMTEEDPITSLLFGARVRTSVDNMVTDEIFRLRDSGNKPNVRDIRFSSADKVERLKEKVGQEEFYKISKKFGEDLAKVYEKEISKADYKKADDLKKKEKLDAAMTQVYEKMMRDNKIFDKK